MTTLWITVAIGAVLGIAEEEIEQERIERVLDAREKRA